MFEKPGLFLILQTLILVPGLRFCMAMYVSRRTLLSNVVRVGATAGMVSAPLLRTPPSYATETIGKDPSCTESTCLGVWDGLLADCPHSPGLGAGCTSSQDDTPGIFSVPWDYSEENNLDWKGQMQQLKTALQITSSKAGDEITFEYENGRYLRVLFVDGKSGEQSVGEFYFTPDDTTVQFRVGSLKLTGGALASKRNIDRCETIRKALRYQKLPVLRNRMRSLFFIESDFDTFGPGSAALGPPAEMRTGELDGRQDVDPRKKLDLLQNFPVSK